MSITAAHGGDQGTKAIIGDKGAAPGAVRKTRVGPIDK